MSFPKVGNLAPTFSLNDQDGSKVSLKVLAKKKCGGVLLLSNDPGCTVQACGLRDVPQDWQTALVRVSSRCQQAAAKLLSGRPELSLLSDEDHAVADKYGAWG